MFGFGVLAVLWGIVFFVFVFHPEYRKYGPCFGGSMDFKPIASKIGLRRVATTLLLSALVLSTPFCVGQESAKPHASGINLLPGYQLQVDRGFDSPSGKISNENGFKIEVEFCCHFGNAAESIEERQIAWKQKQDLKGQSVTFVLTKSHDIVVSFPEYGTNFLAHIRNESEMADMLLMVVTFSPYADPPTESVPKKVPPNR